MALREPADARTRDRAAPALLPPLLEHLGTTGPPDRELRIVDLGSGTGANLRWLAPGLPSPSNQQWVLVDHDPGLLARSPVQATALRADVADLRRVLTELGRVDLVTAAALLDLLDLPQLTAIVEAVVAARVPALFSLSVTGEVTVNPADASDRPLAAAFDAHQQRDGQLGPRAGSATAGLFRDRGWSVLEVPTPWQLTSDADADLIDAWLVGRADAAVEHQPDLAAEAAGWLTRRRAQLRAAGSGRVGAVEALIGHVDVLALPN